LENWSQISVKIFQSDLAMNAYRHGLKTVHLSQCVTRVTCVPCNITRNKIATQFADSYVKLRLYVTILYL